MRDTVTSTQSLNRSRFHKCSEWLIEYSPYGSSHFPLTQVQPIQGILRFADYSLILIDTMALTANPRGW